MIENIVIREMKLKDLDDIVEIEKQSFKTPWSKGAFVQELNENKLAHYLVADNGIELLGYVGMWEITDFGHIINVCVSLKHRKKGVGEKLVSSIIKVAKENRLERITLEVRISNTSAINLYTKLGFKSIGVRPSYYTDNNEDAYIMWIDI